MINHNRKGEVTFTLGPISIHQFCEFSKYGVNALRIFQFIRTQQGLNNRSKTNYRDWVILGNKNLYLWFGVHPPKKHIILKKLERAKLVEVQHRGTGRAPLVRIACPNVRLN